MHTGGGGSGEYVPHEVFLYQLRGDAEVYLRSASTCESVTLPLPAGHVLLVPGGRQFGFRVAWPAGGVVMRVDLDDVQADPDAP